METKTYHTADKSGWGEGPWQSEPDKMQWQDEATGLPCLIVRSTHCTGALCGYVGVAKGHPLFRAESPEVDCHGRCTFTGFCQPTESEETGVCHVPGEGEPHSVWWIGFDCAHGFDISPAMDALLPRELRALSRASAEYWRPEYRTIEYVKTECAKLAAQLAAMK